MAWCRQATSHYLSQCWPRSLPPYDVTRPQRVIQYWTALLTWMISFKPQIHHYIELDQVSNSRESYIQTRHFSANLFHISVVYSRKKNTFFINLILIATNCCKSTSLFEAMGHRIFIKTAQIQWIVGTLFHNMNVLLTSIMCQNITSHLSSALLGLSSSDVNERSQQRSTMEIFLTSLSRKSMASCPVDYS